jgi:hypothetical protein
MVRSCEFTRDRRREGRTVFDDVTVILPVFFFFNFYSELDQIRYRTCPLKATG